MISHDFYGFYGLPMLFPLKQTWCLRSFPRVPVPRRHRLVADEVDQAVSEPTEQQVEEEGHEEDDLGHLGWDEGTDWGLVTGWFLVVSIFDVVQSSLFYVWLFRI